MLRDNTKNGLEGGLSSSIAPDVSAPPFNRFPRRLQNKLSFSHKEFSALLVPSEFNIGPWVIFRLP